MKSTFAHEELSNVKKQYKWSNEKINEIEDLEENTKEIMIEEETDIEKIFKWCDKLEERLERF